MAGNIMISFLRAKAATAFSASQFCLSVSLSHGWISQKRSKPKLPNLHRRQNLRFLANKSLHLSNGAR